ncbi:MAG TPA: alcohol dehydrogenase catalytic domain-containing protein [Solirubrobacterales bacterium]|nr:alcohol dehydrogenase catalytic domain-containing protein [Solirubrobacterales bacterium]
MRAVVLQGPRRVEVCELADPVLLEAGDAIVAVSLAAICGTDLHAYRGEVDGVPPGTVLGHEFVGEIVAVGAAVRSLVPGQRVVASDLVACGECRWCERGWHYQCSRASLFGYGTAVGADLAGGQAELVRVPNADLLLCPIADGIDDEDAVFVADVLATAWMAVAESGLGEGESLAVVGCGPVGLCTVSCALRAGAGAVFAVDSDPRRVARAVELGAVAVTSDGGPEADVVVEAVGSDAALATALELVRPRGTVVAVGAHRSEAMPFPAREAFARELTLKFVVGDPLGVREELLAEIEAGRLSPGAIVSHRLPLERAAEAYRLFDAREAVKVVLRA